MYFLYKNRTFVEKKLCRRPTIDKSESVPVTRLPPILNQYLNQSPTSKRKSEFRHNDSSSLEMYPSDQSVQSKRSVSSFGNLDASSCDETSSSSSESSSEEKLPKEPANKTRPIKSANPRMSAPVISDQQENSFRPATSRPKPKGSTSNLKEKNKEQGLVIICFCTIVCVYVLKHLDHNYLLHNLFFLNVYLLKKVGFIRVYMHVVHIFFVTYLNILFLNIFKRSIHNNIQNVLDLFDKCNHFCYVRYFSLKKKNYCFILH